MNASSFSRLHRRASPQDPCRPRLLRVEPLEDRRLLSAARAADAVNQFAYDVYEHMQNESGNLFFSPLSVATALTMAYAGAAGETASEMANVLHVGTEPGIHASYRDLMLALESQTSPSDGFEISVANAMWPRLGSTLNSNFVDIVENDYGGYAQEVDFSNSAQAEHIINQWVEQQTNGKIEDLVHGLDSSTELVLTNTVYFKGLWEQHFDPQFTGNGSFRLSEDESIQATMMYTQVDVAVTSIDGFVLLEMPFQGGSSSMIFILPPTLSSLTLPRSVLEGINPWLDNPHYISDADDLVLPKFDITVETNFNELLKGLGMPTAFSGDADFSEMTGAGVFIDNVLHKTTLTVNEQGTEAAAATSVEFATCFAAGTPVLTPDGEKRIEELQAGDYVLARDEHNLEGPVEPRMVERVLHGEADIVQLQVGTQVIRTTALHPFFVRGRGWTPAGEIKVEDRLSTNHGDWIEVEKVLHTASSEPVYNLRVSGHRTYFVGSREWKFGVWVHNVYGSFEIDRPFHLVIRDNVTSTISFLGRINNPTQSSNEVNPTVAETPTTADFDGDGDVDGRDFLAWQRGYGMNSSAQLSNGDSNSDGDVDAGDLQVWQTSYGQSSGPQLAALADAALDDEELVVGWLAEKASRDDETTAMDQTLLTNSVSQSNEATAILSQFRPVDNSISSRGRNERASEDGSSWLSEELLERVFG